MERSKERSLTEVVRVLEESGVAYALIGGVAIQMWSSDPRTTLDVDFAVLRYDDLPAARLRAAGFSCTGRHAHSENWVGPDATPVQFTEDPRLATAVIGAVALPLGNLTMRVAAPVDLVHAKLLAASDPARRRSKRLQDLADAQGLVEDHPEIAAGLSAEETALLGGVGVFGKAVT